MRHTIIIFVCFFVRLGFYVPVEKFLTHMETSQLPEVCNCWSILCPLSSEGSFKYSTYSDTGHPFLIVISEHPCHLHLLIACLSVELLLPVFTTLSRLGFEHLTFLHARRTLCPTAPPRRSTITLFNVKYNINLNNINLLGLHRLRCQISNNHDLNIKHSKVLNLK